MNILDYKNNYNSYLAIQNYDPELVIMITYKDSEKTILRTLKSIFDQISIQYRFMILLSDDNSIFSVKEILKDYLNSNIIKILCVNFNSTFLNRNFLIHVSRNLCRNLKIFIRLDSDDIFENKFVLKKICKYFFSTSFYFYLSQTRNACELLLCGNSLYQNNSKIQRINLATNLLRKKSYLLNRLEMMSEGKPEFELPSCNLVWSSKQNLLYPNLKSAEDHMLLINCLLFKKHSLYIEENELLAAYSLSGYTTNHNKKSNVYLESRRILLEYTKFYG